MFYCTVFEGNTIPCFVINFNQAFKIMKMIGYKPTVSAAKIRFCIQTYTLRKQPQIKISVLQLD